ncbi:hypothetical protein RhiirA4_464431 [Rhizophagus irregularis]|uniref:Uncharacterized protein n=1 Tax=Rhizophagus irregularis TaxID=588596 RepID=A0A2I1GQ65_9GLOM|nr:hypothetical protein RhiirA4_464431 [Rhizophagus irregularis]
MVAGVVSHDLMHIYLFIHSRIPEVVELEIKTMFHKVTCELITNDLKSNGNWNFDDTFYSFSGGNITFTLRVMPCGASVLSIQVVSQNGGGNFDARNFTRNDLNVDKYIGVNVITDKQHLFRIQASVSDFKNISCPNPRFSGELCYARYVDPPDCEREKNAMIIDKNAAIDEKNAAINKAIDEKNAVINNCKNEKAIVIVVPIVTAIIVAAGSILAVIAKQYFDKKSSKCDICDSPKPIQ